MKILARILWCAAALIALTPPVTNAQSVRLDELTWTELRQVVSKGTTTALVPIGGTEQSGPHIALGKHNARAAELAQRIAVRLGTAVVAPVVSYAPEGSIDPPAGHMRFAGTVSIPTAVFEGTLEAIARSLRRHGFRDVFFLGDHGGYQASLARVADKLNREWKSPTDCRVHALTAYYAATQHAYVDALRKRGFSDREIGLHAGLADTALTLATAPSLVRVDALAAAARGGPKDGVEGDPTHASAELGQLGVQAVVDTSVAAIREATGKRPH